MTTGKRRWRWRRLLQFNLRMFLLGCSAAAVGVWWYVQPPWERSERELPGGVRIVEDRREILLMKATGERDEQSRGKVTVRTARGRFLIVGRFQQGQAQGKWTFYHENGGRRRTGHYFRGAPVGRWTEWHENGRTASKTDYGEQHDPPPNNSDGDAAIRHATVGWWENGKRRYRGQYVQNQPAGGWQFWDRQGRLAAEGSMVGGLKQGQWHEFAMEGQTSADAFYVAGHRAPAREALCSRAVAGLTSDDWASQREAIDLLAYLGPAGARELVDALEHLRPDLRRFALARLRDMGDDAASVSKSIADWAERGEPEMRLEALLTWFIIAEHQRPAIFVRLLDHAAEVQGRPRFERLDSMSQIAEHLLPHATAVLDGSDPRRQHLAVQLLQVIAAARENDADVRPLPPEISASSALGSGGSSPSFLRKAG